ncbi:MAG: hypothetical protein ACLRL6_17770 [Clostridium sp.]
MEERAAITLSPELESVEHKLADVKRTLAERADKARGRSSRRMILWYIWLMISRPH